MRLDLPASSRWSSVRTPALPELAYIAAQRTRGAWRCRPHRLRMPHLLVVRTGALSLRADGAALTVTGGHVATFPAGCRLADAPGPGAASFCWLGLRTDAAAAELPGGAGPRTAAAPDAVAAAFAAFHAARAGRDPLIVRAQVLACLGLLREACARSSAGAPTADRLGALVARMAERMAQGCADELDPDALADAVGLRRSAFYAAFRARTGFTPGDWILRRRAELAQRLLAAEPRLDDAALARRCGFGSVATLRRAFRRRHGTTPGGWRRSGCR